MQTDVDVHCHSFFDMRFPTGSKRARSPEEVHERPTKRVSRELKRPRATVADVSSSSSRQTSEDWVQQTGVLSIDSPIYTDQLQPVPEVQLTDEPMCTDALESSMRPQLSQLRTTFSPTLPGIMSKPQSRDPPHSSDAPILNSDAPCHLPLINILPPTPDIMLSSDFSTPTRPSTPQQDSPQPMNISPSTSFNNILSPSLSRRQRFTMGPRTDCEKCRLGVKGHWMHFD